MTKNVMIYIGGFELPDKNAAAHRVLSNAKIFKILGKDVIFIGIDKELSPNVDILSTKKYFQGFTSFSVPYPRTKIQWLKYLTSIVNYIKVIDSFANVESIILYNFPSLSMKKILKYTSDNGIKCYADVTEWYSSGGKGLLYKIIKSFDTTYRMRILHKRMDGLIVISRYLEQYYINCEKVVYIPALTDLSELKWKNSYVKNNKILKLVYAGSPEKKDRLDILLDSLQHVNRKFSLDIIGITKEKYLDMFPHHELFLKSCTSITFHGRLKHLDTLDFVKRANYSCFFRDSNRVSNAGFPTKFVEAISCATPVITNSSSNISDYVYEGKNGVILPSLNIYDISKTIDNLPFTVYVESNIFDYNNYVSKMKKFLK